MLIVLDTGPLGMLCNPTARSPETIACGTWFQERLTQGHSFAIPEIADYEVRRELLRGGRTGSLRRLDALKSALIHVPIMTTMMLRAAELWAAARQQGRPTGAAESLDGDMILCAQWEWVHTHLADALIATTNVRHLTAFSRALTWREV